MLGLRQAGAGAGIPKRQQYESALKSDQFLLLAHGTADDIDRAKEIMRTDGPVDVTVHRIEHREAAAGR
jgi:hypothetical protein